MPNYRELLEKAATQKEARHTFETQAVKKAIDLHNALTEEMMAPPDAVITADLKPRSSEEVDLGNGYVLNAEGLRFEISVTLGQVRVGTLCYIVPKGNRLLAKLENRAPIDVTEKNGVAHWCDAMEQIFDDHLDKNLSGRIHAMIEAG